MVYAIIRKRQVFYQLANLPSTDEDIREILAKHGGLRRRFEAPPDTEDEEEDEDAETYQEGAEVEQTGTTATLEDAFEPEDSKKTLSSEGNPPIASSDFSNESSEKKLEGQHEGVIAVSFLHSA